MNKEKMLEKLKEYINNNFTNDADYAKHKGFTRSFLSAILTGKRLATDTVLADIGLVRVRIIKHDYINKKLVDVDTFEEDKQGE